LRILHVPHAYHPVVGGAELICRRVSEILAAQGHEVHVLTTDVGAVQAYYEFAIERVANSDEVIAGVPVKRLKFSGALYWIGGWANNDLYPRWLGRRVAGRIRRFLYNRLERLISKEIVGFRPDVVMAMPHLVTNVQAVISAKSRVEFPLVMVPMLHEHDPNLDIPSTARALSCADAVVALTRHEAGRLTESYGVDPDKIFLAGVGIDIVPTCSSPSRSPERVLFLGRKARSKGIGDLIEAMRVVWQKRPQAELIIAGVRLPETREMDLQIAALPESDRRRIVEYDAVVNREKSELLRSISCLVLPSKAESFGMVILDAWAHKKPLVTWDLPVFRSIIDDGVTGLLADPHVGPPALAEAILRLLENPDAAERMGASGYDVAVRKYSWSSVAAAYLDAYRYAIRTARPHAYHPG
jgi:glycosyltransferase involved in cell wall biosynthesis